jgi:hypothetical protein
MMQLSKNFKKCMFKIKLLNLIAAHSAKALLSYGFVSLSLFGGNNNPVEISKDDGRAEPLELSQEL